VSLAELQPSKSRGVFLQKQRANIYTMLLILAFLNIIVGCLFLYLEMNSYGFKVKVPPEAKPPAFVAPVPMTPIAPAPGMTPPGTVPPRTPGAP
jgi:hypothetical protein